jgi:Cu+-exporting ATPase
MLTGESVPVEKSIGSEVTGASINMHGLSFLGHQSRQRPPGLIISSWKMQGSKAPIARLADSISGVFVPVVMAPRCCRPGWLIATGDFRSVFTI